MEFWVRITAIVLLGILLGLPPDRSFADSTKAEIFSACKEQMKKEFGEAEFSFNKLRRKDGNIGQAYGELTLSDGSKRAVRCTIQRGRFKGVSFRNSNTNRSQGGFWSEDRPAGAVYVPPAEPEAETDTTETAATPEETTTEESGAEGNASGETAATSGDTEGETTETTAAPSDPATPEAPAEDAEAPASTETTETTGAQSQDSDTATSEDDGPRPVFKRVN